MCLYIGYLVACHYAASTLSTYVTAVRALHTDLNLPDPSRNPAVSSYLYAAKKYVLAHRPVRRKHPISYAMLERWLYTLDDSYDAVVAKASCIMAFYDMLRKSEFSVTPNRRYTGFARKNLIFANERGPDGIPLGFIAGLHDDKSGFCRQRFGQQFKHYRDSSNPHCIVRYMWILAQGPRRPGSAPLFAFHNGSPLPYSFVTKCVKQIATLSGRNEDDFNTHSFRTGGAIAMKAGGLPFEIIQSFGRWVSDCAKIYLTQTAAEVQRVHFLMRHAPDTGLDYAGLQNYLFNYNPPSISIVPPMPVSV